MPSIRRVVTSFGLGYVTFAALPAYAETNPTSEPPLLIVPSIAPPGEIGAGAITAEGSPPTGSELRSSPTGEYPERFALPYRGYGRGFNRTLDGTIYSGFAYEGQATTWASLRLGVTLEALRFGVGFGSLFNAEDSNKNRAHVEAFVALARVGYGNLRPYFELRAHTSRSYRTEAADNPMGIGFAAGLLIPLSEYFFLDVNVGRDLVGPESVRGLVGLGIPIQLSHL